MYNTVYECVKPINVYTEKDRQEVRINRNTRWKLSWCGGAQSFKELTGKNEPNGKTMTIALPDELVVSHFKKV